MDKLALLELAIVSLLEVVSPPMVVVPPKSGSISSFVMELLLFIVFGVLILFGNKLNCNIGFGPL